MLGCNRVTHTQKSLTLKLQHSDPGLAYCPLRHSHFIKAHSTPQQIFSIAGQPLIPPPSLSRTRAESPNFSPPTESYNPGVKITSALAPSQGRTRSATKASIDQWVRREAAHTSIGHPFASAFNLGSRSLHTSIPTSRLGNEWHIRLHLITLWTASRKPRFIASGPTNSRGWRGPLPAIGKPTGSDSSSQSHGPSVPPSWKSSWPTHPTQGLLNRHTRQNRSHYSKPGPQA